MSSYAGIVHRPADQQGLVHLPLEQVIVEAWIVDVSARVQLSQLFVNPSDAPTGRAKYVFPIPARAAVCAFELKHADGKIIRGTAKEKSEANQTFNSAIQAGNMAGLVEWVTDDIFTISVGSIPAKETVTSKLTFVMDLMDDGIRDHVRLQLPVSIGMRYGEVPAAMVNAQAAAEQTRIHISVDVQMSEEIYDIRSPSHEIKVLRYKTRIGKKSMRRKSALWSSPTFMERDFVLTVHSHGLDNARCFAEIDPMGSNSVAMQLTLVPRFKMPRVSSQEYIFVVDRSGSMGGGRIETAKSTLSMLLRLLPNDNTLFNIFSFGSTVDGLWQNSVLYNQNALSQAVRIWYNPLDLSGLTFLKTSHIRSMDANYGGTEIANALTGALTSRRRDRSTVAFILTDGESSDLHKTFSVVRNALSAANPNCPLRVFTLGIGEQVSTAMCEGIARAGNGECLLAVTTESITAKCAQLLRAGRTRLIEHISVHWHGSGTPPSVSFSEPRTGISSASTSMVQLVPPPTIQQAPYQITKIYPGMRFIVFAITTYSTVPAEVKLCAKIEGEFDEVDLIVPVIEVKRFKHAKTNVPLIHTLAARRLITDLEDDRAPLPAVVGIAPSGDVIKKAAIVRLGLRYQLLSQYTSFVAVETGKEAERGRRRRDSSATSSRRTQQQDSSQNGYGIFDSVIQGLSQVVSSVFDFPQPPMTYQTMKDDISGIPGSFVPAAASSSSVDEPRRRHSREESDYDSIYTFSTLSSLEGSSSSRWTRSRTPSPPPPLENLPDRSPSPAFDISGTVPLISTAPPPIPSTVYELFQLQNFDGSFTLSNNFATIVGHDAARKGAELNVEETLWATALAVAFLETQLGSEPDLLECLQSKAMDYAKRRQLHRNFEDVVKIARRMITSHLERCTAQYIDIKDSSPNGRTQDSDQLCGVTALPAISQPIPNMPTATTPLPLSTLVPAINANAIGLYGLTTTQASRKFRVVSCTAFCAEYGTCCCRISLIISLAKQIVALLEPSILLRNVWSLNVMVATIVMSQSLLCFFFNACVRMFLISNGEDEIGFVHSTTFPALVFQTVSDALIAASMTRDLIKALMLYAVGRGLVTSLTTFAMVLAIAISPDNLWMGQAAIYPGNKHRNVEFISLDAKEVTVKNNEQVKPNQ
ncbi:hypothetical protein SERLADRAFT_412065 [Serpula lacrymans var. lacrymans S7.9]|uniref:VIT domain-containing protein n=1 Tax=Serpula lacrymans var. lacrymans (strain S7.9) TaxID=578457 RepID=F8PDP6_SERL9|nr:uncharacterized protein SERLADRAFT_412065 [Serpula lacrymans var. lacrymans S7.9]EGO18866.1 hypothetical protein SERLADRAFT_412065 [Serpula lacrymans var. lacrymans S7.9]